MLKYWWRHHFQTLAVILHFCSASMIVLMSRRTSALVRNNIFSVNFISLHGKWLKFIHERVLDRCWWDQSRIRVDEMMRRLARVKLAARVILKTGKRPRVSAALCVFASTSVRSLHVLPAMTMWCLQWPRTKFDHLDEKLASIIHKFKSYNLHGFFQKCVHTVWMSIHVIISCALGVDERRGGYE